MIRSMGPGFAMRAAAAVVAAVGWSALAAQLGLTISAFAARGRGVGTALWFYLGFFTILTNILTAAAMTAVAIGRWPGGARPSARALTGVVVAIVCVGVLYHILLNGRFQLQGLAWAADRTMHYLVPILTAAFWLAFVPKQDFALTDPFAWVAYPLAYLAYVLARGAFDGWYPYAIINVSTLGYRAALTNAAAICVAMLTLGFAIVAACRVGARRGPGAAHPPAPH